ncbi:MAG: four helix bundle protein [Cephaloticoccus sp.]|nr:four helix bundle protein [Cephaloticoccus sp.]
MAIVQTSPNKMTPEVLEDRFVAFAVRIIQLAKHLESDKTGQTVALQVLRAGTSPAANYAEARSAESKADFVHKLRIVIKELNETAVWLRIIDKAGLVASNKLVELNNECEELKRIIGASLRTARDHLASDNKQ